MVHAMALLLNEVLSLNAQEYRIHRRIRRERPPQWSPELECSGIYGQRSIMLWKSLLNEVLSLNAQELGSVSPLHLVFELPQWSPELECSGIRYLVWLARLSLFLNEVLSLNAQEYLRHERLHRLWTVLNEVLSLNAQESKLLDYLEPIGRSSMKSWAWMLRNHNGWTTRRLFPFLNEVLSLNAQECVNKFHETSYDTTFLNEVLSLNAQEWCNRTQRVTRLNSSMKSWAWMLRNFIFQLRVRMVVSSSMKSWAWMLRNSHSLRPCNDTYSKGFCERLFHFYRNTEAI